MKKIFYKEHKTSFLKSVLLYPLTILKKMFRFVKTQCVICECSIEFFTVHSIIAKTKDNRNISIEKDKSLYCSVGDIVLVKVYTNKFGEQCGEVIRILNRFDKGFIGTIKRDSDHLLFEPLDKKPLYPIVIKNLNNIADNTRAKVRIIKYPFEQYKNYLCEVVKSFGAVGEHETEMQTIMGQYDLRQ